MIKIPKYFIYSDYLELNQDIKNHRGTHTSNHFFQYGHKENRKYNKIANANYPFKLYLININDHSYSYFDDLVIDYKTIKRSKNKFDRFIFQYHNIYGNFNLFELIQLIISDNIELIEKGIFSDRDLIKYFSHDKIYDLLHKYISHPDFLNKISNITDTNDNNILSPSEIFKIDNKFRFFYEFFKFSTHQIKKKKFEIKNSVNNKKTAVIIETRNHILLIHVIYNIMFNLGDDWNLHIFCGYDNIDIVKSEFPNVKITLLPFYNLSVNIYDFICMNTFFWNSIDAEDILIFQVDTYLIDSINKEIFDFVYIGAPHLNVHSNVSYLTPNNFGLNGGLSFRKKSAMLECIKDISPTDIDLYRNKYNLSNIIRTPIGEYDIDYSYFFDHFSVNKEELKTDLIFEDVYFSHAIIMSNYPVPRDFVAKHFILQENIYGEIYDVKGVHGWDKNYMHLNYHKKMLKKFCTKLINCQEIIPTKTIHYPSVNIMIICHNMRGGTEKYVRDVIELNKTSLKEKYPDRIINFDILRIKKSYSDCTYFLFNNINQKITKTSKNIFSDKIYDVVHIHYFNEPAFLIYDHLMEIISDQKLRPKVIITLHDYHFIVNDEKNEYHLTIFNSNILSLDELKLSENNIIPYSKYRLLFNEANLIVTGSYILKKIYNHVFDLNNDLIKVVPHPEKIYFQEINRKLDFNNLNIGIIGAISVSKGSHIIQEMGNIIIKKTIPWKIFHIGSGFNTYPGIPNNIHSIGPYSSEIELRELLIKHNINLLWFPAFRHESFCYTLTLAMQSGLPIIAFDSGTFKERLYNYKSPYFIHLYRYNCTDLFNDIYHFWTQLKSNKYIHDITKKTNYDSLDYSKIYDINS